MEGSEDKVSGHGCLHRDRRALEVTHLTDHDDIWVLAKESLEPRGIGIVLFLIDLTLYDSLEFILDRIFESDDFSIRSIQAREHRVERRRLT